MPLPKLTLALAILLITMAANHAYAQTNAESAFFLYEDSSRTITPGQAASFYDQGRFSKTFHRQKNVGFTRSVFWLAFNNPTQLPADSLVIFIGHHHINRIHFYYVENGSPRQLAVTGDYYPFRQRPLKTTGFYFPISRAGLYLAKVDKANESLQLSFDLRVREEVMETEKKQATIIALFTGMITLLVIFGVYLFTITGDRVYLFYILYMAAGWLWVLANSGHGFQYLWPNQAWFASKARPVFAITPLIFSMLFLKRYIGGIQNKRTLLLVQAINWILFVCIICILLFREEGYASDWWFYIQYFIPLISLVFVMVTLSVLIHAVWRGNRLALFYLVAIGVLFVFVLLQILFSLGKLESSDNFFSHFGLSIGYIMEAIILTAGLVYRFNQYRLEKENLLIKMNKQQQETTEMIIQAQRAERTQVANQLHDVAGSLLSAARLNLAGLQRRDHNLDEDTLSHLEKTDEALGMVAEMVRNLSHALSPIMLEKTGFKQSLEKIVAIVNASGKIRVELLVHGFDVYDSALGKHYNLLYSMIYELLNNIVKHSGAQNVLLQVTNLGESFLLLSEDDGIGMDMNAIEKNENHGLAGIRATAKHFGGSMLLDSNQPSGLIVTIELPYNHEEI